MGCSLNAPSHPPFYKCTFPLTTTGLKYLCNVNARSYDHLQSEIAVSTTALAPRNNGPNSNSELAQQHFSAGTWPNSVRSCVSSNNNLLRPPAPHKHSLRHATLPAECVCTENLTPFLNLFPYPARAGVVTLLEPHKIFDAGWHSLGVHVRVSSSR